MVCVGVAIGLVAAFLQAVCYVVSGGYVARTKKPGWTLTAPQRLGMAVPYAVLAWEFRPETADGIGWAVIAATVFAMLSVLCGDAGLFQMQRHVEPSRISPLQVVKVPVVMVFAAVFFGEAFRPSQCLAVGLVVVSAAMLCGAGRRIPAVAWGWLGVCAASYAVSDMAVGQLLVLTRGACGGVLRSALFVLGLTHLASSALSVPLLCMQRAIGAPVPSGGEWMRYALPYGAMWLLAMVFLLVCFSLSGVVLGVVVQSTRGLFSVALGRMLARCGFDDIEQAVSRRMFFLRIVAAVLAILAMVLYAV